MKNEMASNRTCFGCKTTWPLTTHHFYRSNTRYFQRECKTCNKKRRSLWWKSEKGKLSSAETKLKRRFNLSLEEYALLLKAWNNRCGICGAEKSAQGHRLAVDHDHTANQIRGILCKACNVGLGNFKDSVTLLHNAIIYIDNFSKFKVEAQ